MEGFISQKVELDHSVLIIMMYMNAALNVTALLFNCRCGRGAIVGHALSNYIASLKSHLHLNTYEYQALPVICSSRHESGMRISNRYPLFLPSVLFFSSFLFLSWPSQTNMTLSVRERLRGKGSRPFTSMSVTFRTLLPVPFGLPLK